MNEEPYEVPSDVNTRVQCNECHVMFVLFSEGHNRLLGHPTKKRAYICDTCIAEQHADEQAWATATDEERAVTLAEVSLLLERAKAVARDSSDDKGTESGR
jgi:hypothetical protein